MTSKTRYSHRVICRDCKTRQRIRRAPDAYKRKPACRSCGARELRSIEASRRRELEKQERCYCTPIPFPHRRASIFGCVEHPDAGREWNADDWKRFRRIVETPRSGG